MLYSVTDTLDSINQKRYEVRKKLMQLSRKYRKLDKITKKGLIQMEQNFLYYLNCGSDVDEMSFFADRHKTEALDLMKIWKDKDTAFERILNGKLTVIAEIEPILKGLD